MDTKKEDESTIQDTKNLFNISKRYTYYALFLLWLVALVRFVDLQIIAILLEDIRQEFGFTDTQLGLLTGLTFALFYATLGLPIAWLADRYSRRNIISVALGVWSLMTACCGLANSYLTLFLSRMGVGIGEAGGYPPTTSILADYFPPEKRGMVFSILGAAIPAGVFVGFLIGGFINQYYGWRMAFLAVGIPGIVLAVLVRFTLKEPPRGHMDKVVKQEKAPPMKECLKRLWAKPAYRWLVAGACLATLGASGSGVWIPSFFIRVHGMTSAEVGLWMAFIYGGGGISGALLGGFLADWKVKKTGDESWYMRVCSLSLAGIAPFAIVVYLWPEAKTALLMQLVVVVLMHMNIGLVLAQVQNLSGPTMRSMGQAVNVLVTNLIALSMGPLLVGMLSDYLVPLVGEIGLGYSILVMVIIAYSSASLVFAKAAQVQRGVKDNVQINANIKLAGI